MSIQLAATGVQDVYLTGEPQVSFFHTTYKRHTNFSMECIEQEIVGIPRAHGISTITISRSGDLVREMFLEAQMPAWEHRKYAMEVLIESCEFSIGGQPVETHYSQWWRLFSELFHNDAKKTLYSKMVNSENGTQTCYLPFIFFFNRHPGLALPLIALQYHNVKLEIKWMKRSQSADLAYYTGIKCWANYIFLDAKERRLFAENPHEYLIEQVNFTEKTYVPNNVTTRIRLNIHHPVKELVWCFNEGPSYNSRMGWKMASAAYEQLAYDMYAYYNTGRLGTSNAKPHESLGVMRFKNNRFWGERNGWMKTFKLMFNGIDRFAMQPGFYFNQIQPYYYHSGNPVPGVYSYSFALKPEVLQPSGTCNFSRINDTIAVIYKTGGTWLSLFSINYNILKIKSGMGGVLYTDS